MTNANAMQSECPRCKRDESYGCSCTSQEMVKWQADRIDALEAALRGSDTAINDWLARYAGEFCHESHVKEADERISDAGGTLAYIATVTAANRAALGDGE